MFARFPSVDFVTVGGNAGVGDWNTKPDPNQAQRLWDNAVRHMPQLQVSGTSYLSKTRLAVKVLEHYHLTFAGVMISLLGFTLMIFGFRHLVGSVLQIAKAKTNRRNALSN